MKVSKTFSIAVVLLFTTVTAFAQTNRDAIKAYNSGLELANSNDYEMAIDSLEKALEIATQLGPEGEDIKNRTVTQIPTVYFRKAREVYQTFQQSKSVEDLNKTIEAFREVVEVGEQFNDNRVTPRAKGVIPQLYYQMSVLHYSNDELVKAMEAVDNALNENSNYAVAYYQKAKIIKKQGDTDGDGIIDEQIEEMLNWYDRAIQVADMTNKRDIAEKAREAAHDEMLAVGTRASENGDLDMAFEMLNKGLEYEDESSNLHYRLAEAYNKAKNPEKAVEHANVALDYENGGRTDKAKIYYELGYAHQTLGNKSVACDAFTNALYGSFKSPAEHKMEFELKCDSTTR